MKGSAAANLREFLARPKGPQLGSFGEAVFARTAKRAGMRVESLHNERADFVVDGRKTDVKTTARTLSASLPPPAPWAGTRIDGVQYAMVESHRDGLRISIEGRILANLSWLEAEEVWANWRSGAFGRVHLPSAATARGLSKEVTEAVNRVFDEAGLPHPLVLYRTCHWLGRSPSGVSGFQEGPHNLLPSQRRPNKRRGWTVYLIFSKAPADLASLFEIVAFPDSREPDLPRQERVSLGTHEKADMKRLPADVRFRSLEALRKHLIGVSRRDAP